MKASKTLFIGCALLSSLLILSVKAEEGPSFVYFQGGDKMEITSARREGDFLEVTSKDGTVKYPKSALGDETLRQYFPESVSEQPSQPPASPTNNSATPTNSTTTNAPASTPPPSVPIPDANEVLADLPLTLAKAPESNTERKYTAKKVVYEIHSQMFDSAKLKVEALVPQEKGGKIPDSASNIIFFSAYGGFKDLLKNPQGKPGPHYLWELCEVYGFTVFTVNFTNFKYEIADDHEKCFYYPESHSYDVIFQARDRLLSDFGLKKKKMMMIGESGGCSMAERLALFKPNDFAAVALTGAGRLEAVPAKIDSTTPWLVLYVRGDVREKENIGFVQDMRTAGANVLCLALAPYIQNKDDIPKNQNGASYHHAPSEYDFSLLQQFIIDNIKLTNDGLLPTRWPLVASTSSPYHIEKNKILTELDTTLVKDKMFFPSERFATEWARNIYRKIQLPPSDENDSGLQILVHYPPATDGNPPKGIILLNLGTTGIDALGGDYLDYLSYAGYISISADFSTKEKKMLQQTKSLLEWTLNVKAWSDFSIYMVGIGTGGRHLILASAGQDNSRIKLVAAKDAPLDWPFPELSPMVSLDKLFEPILLFVSTGNQTRNEAERFALTATTKNKNITLESTSETNNSTPFDFLDKVLSKL